MSTLEALRESKEKGLSLRPMAEVDLPWALELARKSYPFTLDARNALAFGQYAIGNDDMLLLRGERSVGCVSVNSWVFNESMRFAHEMFVYAEKGNDWESYYLVKRMVQWAAHKGAMSYCTSSFTGASSVTEAFAKRLGATRVKPYYEIPLNVLH